MIRTVLLGGAAALAMLAACGPAGKPAAPGRADLSAEVVHRRQPGPPPGPEGACWATDTSPLVIETVSEQVLVSPEELGPDGAVLRPAVFRSVSQQNIVQEREEIWFRAPCPDAFTVSFVASLQRALKARGLYVEPVTGSMDAATEEAVRRYQASRGLDSRKLSLVAARELGLVAAELPG